jgi:hypothetical protein
MSETSPNSTYPEHMEKAPAGLFELHACRQGVGSLGFVKRYRVEWNFGEQGRR